MTPGVMAAGAAITLLYAPLAIGLLRQWYDDPATSHGIALVIAAAVLVRWRWSRLRALPAAPVDAGFVLLSFVLLLHVAATFAGELFLLRVSALFSIAAVTLTVAGRQHLRLLAAPFVLLLLAIPLPATVVTSLTLPLQLTASEMATGLLGVAGVSVTRDGNILTLSNVSLEVAEACSGLRSIVSLVAMIAIFKALTGGQLRHAVILSLAAVPVAIAGNTLRVTATGLMTQAFGPGMAKGFIHDLTGYAAFLIMCLALAGIHWLLTRRNRRHRSIGEPCESPALA